MHNISISHKYEMLSRKVIEEHPDLHWIRRAGVSICYLESDQAKKNSAGLTLAECMLVREPYQVFCPYDFLIIVYTPNIIRMNEEQEKILLYHELLHVDMTEKEGKPVYRTVPHDVQDFRRIIDRYGLDWAGDCGG